MLRVIAEYLRVSKCIQTLSLNYCQIGNEVATAIGKGLQSNERLEVLSLKHNNIRADGMYEIVDALKDNHYLKIRILDLSSNKLNDAIGTKLA